MHTQGIDNFKKLVEGYFGKKMEPFRPMKEWKYMDWMGWHEQGDGNSFLGVNIEQGRVRDFNSDLRIKSAFRKIVDELDLTMILCPSQSVIFKDVAPGKKDRLNAILKEHGLLEIEKVDPLIRNSMACPALPLCGLAVTEAERRMPEWVGSVRKMMDRLGLGSEEVMLRMTGCPNGCARPYMSELALVGDGPDMYQVWLGGSPVLTRVSFTYADKVKYADMEKFLEPIFVNWRDNRKPSEALGDFAMRVGKDSLKSFCEKYHA